MIKPSKVSAVLVTKGDHDLSEIHDSIRAAGIRDIVVWDNSEREHDLSCYGRYAAVPEARKEWIYHQDDDLIAPVAEILAEVDPVADRHTIVANNREEETWRLTGIGSVFHRSLADCFERYVSVWGNGADFHRICDVVFAYQHPYRKVVLGYRDLPWGTAPDRMYHQDGHMAVREQARSRVLAL